MFIYWNNTTNDFEYIMYIVYEQTVLVCGEDPGSSIYHNNTKGEWHMIRVWGNVHLLYHPLLYSLFVICGLTEQKAEYLFVAF